MMSANASPAARISAAAAALLFAAALPLAAQDAAPAADDDMFAVEESVEEAAEQPAGVGGNQGGFLKYDQVKVGGSISGEAAYKMVWPDAWGGSADFLDPDARYISPDLEGKITLVAKPAEDFGVNVDLRTSWPFSATAVDADGAEVSVPNISVWAFYSKFNWKDSVYFSFGKQPLSWGVSSGAFQPADDIFALSADIDLEDTGAEREGPVSLKMTLPLSPTNNFYFLAGLPLDEDDETKIDPADARVAAKVEYGFGDAELALAGYYCYNDHPRAILMGTSGLGNWNIYGEAVLKYGSERYFLSKDGSVVSGEQEDGNFYFTGTLGAYYNDVDEDLTVAAAYFYNGESQEAVAYDEALLYYAYNADYIDRIKYGEHYAFASISKGDLWPQAFGEDHLTVSLVAIANLQDLSGYVMPSVTWELFDYASLKLGATFSFGEAGDEYITYGVGSFSLADLPDEPGAAISLTLILGSGSF